jgi:ketosteroid isomerase-like protein
MNASNQTLIDLEQKFWKSIVDQDADTAVSLLAEPALMVSSHGSMQFDHDGYRQMAEKGSMVLTDYELDDMKVLFAADDTAILTYKVKQTMSPRGKPDRITQEMADTSTWVKKGQRWLCVMHTETPVGNAA